MRDCFLRRNRQKSQPNDQETDAHRGFKRKNQANQKRRDESDNNEYQPFVF
jgi:hypothetical protein